MHYYQFHIGDYRKDTAHLSKIEHYIYRCLIDTYYLDEKPIKTKEVIRRLRLETDQVILLENVLNDFFFIEDDEWHHERIDADIADYKEKADRARKNGKLGGRPKAKITKVVNSDNPDITRPVNSSNPEITISKPNHKPLTNNHKPINQEPKDQEKGKTKKRFSPPQQTEVIEYSVSKNLNTSGFFDYYTSNGWMVGKNKMKDWKASARGWSGRQGNYSGGNGSQPDRQKYTRKPSKDFINQNPHLDENVLDGEFTRMKL